MTWRRACLLVIVFLGGFVADARALAPDTIRLWREQPIAFVRENFHVEPDAWQADALQVFANPAIPRISLQACAGPGKTAVMAWMAWHFLACQGDKGEHPNGAAVSITGDNLKDGLWKELAKWQGRSPYLAGAFTWTAERVFLNSHPATWWLSARTWPKAGNADEQGRTLSGLHGQYVLALIDESGAIPTPVLRAGEQALSTGSAFGKLVQAGNPISLDGMLYAAASTLRDQWHVLRVTGDPDDPKAWVHAPRLMAMHRPDDRTCSCSLCWARQQIAAYGRDNPWVQAYVLGQFPPSSINSLLGIDDVDAAMTRHLREDAYAWAQKRLGIDVARFGDDRTVIFPRQGLVAFRPAVMRHARDTSVSVLIANRVLAAKRTWGSETEFIDATGGWAAGASDVLRDQGFPPVNVQFAAPAFDPRYYNRRAEIWFQMAEWVKRGGALPPLPEMVAELVTPTYTFKNGKFLLEEKDQVKKRIGRSPDLADALALTFGLPDMPAQAAAAHTRNQARAVTEWDPFDEARV